MALIDDPRRTTRPSERDGQSGRAIRILLVEDHSDDALLVQRALHGAVGPSYEVSHVTGLAAALGRLAQSSFDVILSDLVLPDSAGIDTLVALQKAAPLVPV